jgi:hypothetical protein
MHSSEDRNTQWTSAYSQGWWKYDGFWSCCGLDGLCAVFLLALELISPLSETHKQSLLRLLKHLAEDSEGKLVARVAELDARQPEQRLEGLLELDSRLPS